MSKTLKTKLRGLTAALTAFVLAFSLAPATAFASWGNFTDSSNQTITGSISVSGVDSTYHNIYVYQVAKTQVSDANATQWVAVDSNGDTSTSGTSYDAIASWIDADGSTKTAETLKSLIKSNSLGALVASYVNGAQGTGTISFSTSGQTTTASVSSLDSGIYVVLVENNSAGAESSTWGTKIYQTMVLSINVEADGTSSWKLASDGKNASTLKYSESSIEKSLIVDSSGAYYTAGDELTFQVAVTIPTSGSVTYFYVEDLLTGLEYVENSLVVYSDKPTASSTSVTGTQTSSGSYAAYTNKDTHDAAYTGHSFNSTAGTDQEVLHIDFDSDFISTYAGQTVYIVYKAQITPSGITNGSYNEVTSSVIVDSGNENSDGGDRLDVSYGITFFAYYVDNGSNVGLNNVEFAVYSSAPTYDSSSGSWTDGGTAIYSNLTTATDSTKGAGYVSTSTKALKADTTYYVVETKVPSGYALPTTPVELALDTTSGEAVASKGSYDATTNMLTVSIEQTKSSAGGEEGSEGSGIDLPATGGLGTILLTAVGVLIVVAGAYYTLRSRKQRQQS